jgi:hypothetical protein
MTGDANASAAIPRAPGVEQQVEVVCQDRERGVAVTLAAEHA